LSDETEASGPKKMVSIPEEAGFSQPEGHETKLETAVGAGWLDWWQTIAAPQERLFLGCSDLPCSA